MEQSRFTSFTRILDHAFILVLYPSRFILFLICPLFSSAAQYVPGQPGGNWTQEEVMVVKAKLIQIISNPHTPYAQLFPGHNWTWTRMPTAAKFLRLGFHDCLKCASCYILSSCNLILGTLMTLVVVMGV